MFVETSGLDQQVTDGCATDDPVTPEPSTAKGDLRCKDEEAISVRGKLLDYDGGVLLALISAPFNLKFSGWRPAGVCTHSRTFTPPYCFPTSFGRSSSNNARFSPQRRPKKSRRGGQRAARFWKQGRPVVIGSHLRCDPFCEGKLGTCLPQRTPFHLNWAIGWKLT
jgi:hypothetical protein